MSHVLENTGVDWLDRRFHQDLAPEAEREIRAAGLNWQRESIAEAHLARALAIAPDHLAVIIAHYRYYFYKHRYIEAERYARRCLEIVGAQIGAPVDWKSAGEHIKAFDTGDADVRFWLFALQAYGYVLLRLNRREEGLAAFDTITKLDPKDDTKTRVLLKVITSPSNDYDD